MKHEAPPIVSHGNAKNPTNYYACELHFQLQPLKNTTNTKLQHIKHSLLRKMLRFCIQNIRRYVVFVFQCNQLFCVFVKQLNPIEQADFVPCQPSSYRHLQNYTQYRQHFN
jgi:hypothetical protein